VWANLLRADERDDFIPETSINREIAPIHGSDLMLGKQFRKSHHAQITEIWLAISIAAAQRPEGRPLLTALQAWPQYVCRHQFQQSFSVPKMPCRFGQYRL